APCAVGARAQGLEERQLGVTGQPQEAHGAVGEGEVGAAPMAAAEGAGPVPHRGDYVAVGPHLVVDRHGGAERDLGIDSRDVSPPAKVGEGNSGGGSKNALL